MDYTTINYYIMKQQIKSNSIKSKEDINIIKKHLKLKQGFFYSRHLLYFILGINVCLKPNDLLKLQWKQILNDNGTIKDFIIYNGYRFYLNKSCKDAIYHFISQYDNYKYYMYVFGDDSPLVIQTINKALGDVEKALCLPYNLSALSLHKTFIYWQIVNYHYDYIKMSKLKYMLYQTSKNKDLNTYAEYNINDDMIYINDVNL